MALLPEGPRSQHVELATVSTEPPVEDRKNFTLLPEDPVSGEPSDNHLHRDMHREFRDALDRDPILAVELARRYVFTQELDPQFRLEILRELKILQFTHSEVSDLAGEILEKAPNTELFEEALSIKFAALDPEEFEILVSEMKEKIADPEKRSILKANNQRINSPVPN